MDADTFLNTIIRPHTDVLADARFWSGEALAILLVTAGQESRWRDRVQVGGPAHGFWQFERGGQVTNVLFNRVTRDLAARVCHACGVDPEPAHVYGALIENDKLALGFARLAYWADPHPLPAIGDAVNSFHYYNRNWHPGAPDPARWLATYNAAAEAIHSLVSSASKPATTRA